MDRRRIRRGAAVLLSLLLLAIVIHGGVWFWVTGRILEGIPAFTAQAAREGWTLGGRAPSRGGWPFAATVHVPGVSATRQLGGTSFVWTTERLDLTIAPRAPDELRIAPSGRGTIRLGTDAPIPVTAESAALAVPLDGTALQRLTVSGLVLGASGSGLSVGRVEARIGAGAVAGTAGPVLVAGFPAPFDSGATLSGRILATPPIPAAATPGRSAAAWRAAGGQAAVQELLLDWGPLRVEGTVEGGLDAQLQPAGQARLRVTGALEVLEAASRAGVIQPGPKAAARAVLTLLTLAAKGGAVALPVTLRDRTLTVAQFALLQVPPISWDLP